jgi:hypothetical protein
MPPETTENTPPRSGLGAPRVTYRIEDLSLIMPEVLEPMYFEGRNPEHYWNSLSEDNLRGIAQILFLEGAPNYREHLNYVFDYGRSYSYWRGLWEEHRPAMVEIRTIIYDTISNMTVSQASDMARILSETLEDRVGLSSYAIGLLSRWIYSLHLVYSDGSVAFPIIDSSYTTLSVPTGTRLRALHPSLMQYISSSATQYANLTFNTLDERFLYLGNVCRTVAMQARHIAHSRVLTEEEKEYIREELANGLDISPDGLYTLMQAENNLGNPVEIMELAISLYSSRLWAPFENAFLPVPYNYNVTVDPEVTHTSEEILSHISINTDSVLTTLNTRRALENFARAADANDIFLPPRTVLRNYLTTIRIPEDVIETTMENLRTDQQVEEALAELHAGRQVNVIREDHEHTPFRDISVSELEGTLNPEQAGRFIEITGTTAPRSATTGEGTLRGQEYRYSFNSTGGGTIGGFTGSDVDYAVTVDQGPEVPSVGVMSLNDLANAHSYNRNPQVEFEKIKVASEQEIWEGLQKDHAGMMETIQYILDDCTIDYKETNKTKRIDKMKNEMVPRIKGVLLCMNDRLIPEEVHYINKWLWDLINFAINCNQPLPYRRLAPDIQKWDKKKEPRIKRIHTALHIPRLSE